MDPIGVTITLMTDTLNFILNFWGYLSLCGALLLPGVIYLAVKGQSVGVRRTYVKILLTVFEVS